MKLYQIEKPFIAYTLCFDDVMRTYLQNKGIPYIYAFGTCWEFEYSGDTEDMACAVTFPSVGFGKYESLGIRIVKKEIEDRSVVLKEIRELLARGKVIPIHYDGYYCRWDPMLKTKRWHNRHIVLARETDKKEKNLIVDDPHFSVHSKKLSFSELGTASKFYYLIQTENYKKCTVEEHFRLICKKYKNENPIKAMEHFLIDLKEKAKCKICDWLFAEKWNLMISNGYMTRHFLWLYFRELYSNTGEMKFGILEWQFFGALQLWNECLTHSLKGARRKDKRIRLMSFIESFQAVIAKEKEIYTVLCQERISDSFQIVSLKKANRLETIQNIDLASVMNARSCKKSIYDKEEADLTGEGEYIVPFHKYINKVKIHGIDFSVRLGDSFDSVRCEGQEIPISGGKDAKGIALLICTEWGSTQFYFKAQGLKKEYGAECVIEDFTNQSAYSLKVGRSYLKGKSHDKLFQKRVYFRYAYFEFSERDTITSITLSVCPSVHIFSAVFVQ